MVMSGLAPSTVAPPPIVLPLPAIRFHRSNPDDKKLSEVHVSQAKTPNTSSSAPEGTVTLAELLVALFPAKAPNGSV